MSFAPRADGVNMAVMQFYRVEVKVLPPEQTGAPRTRSVLRRYSHFKKLHGRVRTLLQRQMKHNSQCIMPRLPQIMQPRVSSTLEQMTGHMNAAASSTQDALNDKQPVTRMHARAAPKCIRHWTQSCHSHL